MSELVWCPACGRPGLVERDVLGNERVVCDAYKRCATDEQDHARDALAAGIPGWMVDQDVAEWRAERERVRLVRPAPLFDGAAG
jgi:hypothetical protein